MTDRQQAVVGIDPARACGWGVLARDSGALLGAGRWDLSIRTGEGAGMPLVRLRRYLADLFDAFDVTVLAYEHPMRHTVHHGGKAFDNTPAAHLWGQITGVLLEELERRGMSAYAAVQPAIVKHVACGKGNAKKEAMMRAAVARWGDGPWSTDDNVADALWLAECARIGRTA